MDRFKTFLDTIKLFNYTSQFGEDSILESIFSKIGTANKWCLEVGAADGLFVSNTAKLINEGWKSIQIECDDSLYQSLRVNYGSNENVYCIQETIGLENGRRLEDVLKRVDAPKDIDLVVIDVDGQDYYIFNSLTEYHPRVVLIEFDPNTGDDFIPSPNGQGQAGLRAMAKLLKSKRYDIVCATSVNIIAIRADLSYLIADEPIQGEIVKSELLITDQGLTTTIEIEDLDTHNKEQLRVAALTSVPRHGFTVHQRLLFATLLPLQIPLKVVGGVWWEKSLQNGIISLIDGGADVIIFIDYDSIFFPEDLRKMFLLLVKHPNIDALVPWQLRRGPENNALFGMRKDGNGEPISLLHPSLFMTDVTKIDTGHFGLTMIRTKAFKDLPKPWFLNVPNPDGDWKDGQVNADIYFWKKFKEHNRNSFVANSVQIGHIDEVVLSLDENFQVRKQTIYDYLGEHNGSK